MSIVHFKCMYDPSWDYPAIARDLFGGGKCLVVAEKLATNAHVHFQGYTELSERQVERHINALGKTHFQKLVDPNARPLKRARRDVDETGFQYLCKEDRPPLYSQGISEEEFASLRGASTALVTKLKTGMRDYLHARPYSGPAATVHSAMRMDAIDWYIENDMRPSPRFQKDILWTMVIHPSTTLEWKAYCAERI